ncbi:MAG: EAL domain-containing protein, partial [Gammaproteobacteria bacterium]
EEKFAAAFHASPNLIAITRMSDGTIVDVNDGYSQLLGYSRAESIGKTTTDLSIWASESDRAIFVRNLEKHGEIADFETTLRRKDGEIITVIDSAKTLTLQGVEYVLSVAHDITGRKAAEEEIERLAFQDPLTMLPNRRLLLDRLHQALVAGIRSKRRGALLFIDLDNFKILNDTFGHDAGDQLLIEVARRLATCVREGDTISRFGGDEFMLMLNDLGDNNLEAMAQIKVVGEKIMSALNLPYMIDGYEHHSTPSIGVALFSGGENSIDDLMKQADIAMYQAKSEGRNMLRFFDPEMQAALAERAAMETELRRAVDEEQFTLLYQPQVDAVRGIIGAEALLRWNCPERGVVLPDQFVPLAEETGLILPIGQWVLQTACNQLKKWAENPRCNELKLAVNVSARQFRQDDFVDQVRIALEESGAPATRLKMELTESLLLDDIEGAIKKMRAIKQLGVGFALDDFGTGYSSMSYLTRLPLDQLKIDQSFVHNMLDNQNDAVIAQTIITMAKSLNLSVIAEGVETEGQRQFLEQHGCSTYQGYLFSQPFIQEKIYALLKSSLIVS